METLPILDIYVHVISFAPASPSFVDHVYAVLEDHRNVILEVDLKGIGFQIIMYQLVMILGIKHDQFVCQTWTIFCKLRVSTLHN